MGKNRSMEQKYLKHQKNVAEQVKYARYRVLSDPPQRYDVCDMVDGSVVASGMTLEEVSRTYYIETVDLRPAEV